MSRLFVVVILVAGLWFAWSLFMTDDAGYLENEYLATDAPSDERNNQVDPRGDVSSGSEHEPASVDASDPAEPENALDDLLHSRTVRVSSDADQIDGNAMLKVFRNVCQFQFQSESVESAFRGRNFLVHPHWREGSILAHELLSQLEGIEWTPNGRTVLVTQVN